MWLVLFNLPLLLYLSGFGYYFLLYVTHTLQRLMRVSWQCTNQLQIPLFGVYKLWTSLLQPLLAARKQQVLYRVMTTTNHLRYLSFNSKRLWTRETKRNKKKQKNQQARSNMYAQGRDIKKQNHTLYKESFIGSWALVASTLIVARDLWYR